MDELINNVVERVGIDRTRAEKAIGIVLGLVRQQGDPDKVREMFALLPGADDLARQHGGQARSGGLFGGLSSLAGPMLAMSKLKSAGLSANESQRLGQEVLAFAKEKCGEPLVKDVARSIPGLSSFV